MNYARPSSFLFALSILLLAGCGSSGGLGDILGGGQTGDSGAASDEVRGTIDDVDTRSRTIVLRNVDRYGSSAGGTMRIDYDDRTRVQFQGQSYRPDQLERGDEVDVRLLRAGDRWIADTVIVTRDISGGSTYPGGGGSYGSTLRGTVRTVDTTRRRIEVERQGQSQATIVQYDTNTRVSHDGRSYRPEDLERGDEIDIVIRQASSGQLWADEIRVVRDVSGGGYGGGTYGSAQVVRGTVRYVDTARRTIELEQASWISRFNPGTGSAGIMVIQYDANTTVEFGGRQYSPVNLERGDVIEVQVRESGTSLWAERITVVRDVNR